MLHKRLYLTAGLAITVAAAYAVAFAQQPRGDLLQPSGGGGGIASDGGGVLVGGGTPGGSGGGLPGMSGGMGMTGAGVMSPSDQLAQEEAAAHFEALSAAKVYVQAKESNDDNAASNARSALAGSLERQFDAQQKRRRLEIEQLEKRLKKINELVARRETMKEDLIRRRAEALINEEEGLGWNDGAVNSAGAGMMGGPAMGFGSIASPIDPFGRSPDLAPGSGGAGSAGGNADVLVDPQPVDDQIPVRTTAPRR